MSADHERYMRMALEEAEAGGREGNMAVGGVLVRDGEVLGRGHNEANSTFDVTAHAETVVIRRASIHLRVRNPTMRVGAGPLAGSTLYTTVEPCPMCAWAICLAGIPEVVIGVRHAELGASFGGYAIERLIAMTGQPLRVVSGFLRDECAELRRRIPRP
jgi:tRNA(adenine34) deaminase